MWNHDSAPPESPNPNPSYHRTRLGQVITVDVQEASGVPVIECSAAGREPLTFRGSALLCTNASGYLVPDRQYAAEVYTERLLAERCTALLKS